MTGGNPNIMTHSRPKHIACNMSNLWLKSAKMTTWLEADHTPRGRCNWQTLKEEFIQGMFRGIEELVLKSSATSTLGMQGFLQVNQPYLQKVITYSKHR